MTRAATAVLLRTHYVDDRLLRFADRIEREAGLPVTLLVDETKRTVDCGPRRKLSLTRHRLAALGLPAPADVGWRCGDYGFYLAAREMPDARHFLLIEHDVAIRFADFGSFFALFRDDPADLIAAHLRQAGREQFWYPTMALHHREVWRCLFGLVRLSRAAVELCLAERQRMRRAPTAHIMWPNDETFVCTTVVNARLRCKDLGLFGPDLCTVESFSFHDAKNGDDIDARPPDERRLYHPVLYGQRYTDKLRRLATAHTRSEVYRLKALRALIRLNDLRCGEGPLAR